MRPAPRSSAAARARPAHHRATATKGTLDRRAALARVLATHDALDRTAALARDPVRFARRFDDRDDRELAALLSALMAFGNVTVIGRKLDELFQRLDQRPAYAARTSTRDELRRALAGFTHRTFRGASIADLLYAAGRVSAAHPRVEGAARSAGLYTPLALAYDRTHALRSALAHWVDALRAHAWPAGMTRVERHLLPDPAGPSASKRLLLLCRWISRPDDGVDLGLAVLPTRALLVPLDVHLHRVSRALGFTTRAVPSWAAAEEVTAALRALDPDDPVRFDFALCHTEIAARIARVGRTTLRAP